MAGTHGALLTEIVDLIEVARRRAARMVNSTMTAVYWSIGRRIVVEEQHGVRRAEYREELIEQLAQRLTTRFGRGFGRAYAHVPMVSPFRRHIGEAIEAAYLGLFHAAVATLIPTIEGIVRQRARQAGRDLGNAGLQRLGTEIEQMVAVERQAHPGCTASEERIAMFEMFCKFLRESLYIHANAFAGDRELNRQGAVHGIYLDYGHAANFCVPISVLDVLTFVLTFRTSGTSMMAPDMSIQSRRLGLYFIALREIGPSAARAAGRDDRAPQREALGSDERTRSHCLRTRLSINDTYKNW